MSACLQRSSGGSQRAPICPVCVSLAGAPGTAWGALDGAVSPLAGTLTRCRDCANPTLPAPAAVPVARSGHARDRDGMRRRPAVPDDRRVPASPDARTPGRQDASSEWTRFPATRLRCIRATRTWRPDWRDRHVRFHLHDQREPSPGIGGQLREIDRDLNAILRGWAVRAVPVLAAPLPARACPASRSPRGVMNSSGISRTAPDHPRRPGGRGHTTWHWLAC
jgi:hypothetical protein